MTTTEIDVLITRRIELAETMTDTYDSDAFPGTPAWRRGNVAMMALDNFDKLYPEALAEIRRRRTADLTSDKMLGM